MASPTGTPPPVSDIFRRPARGQISAGPGAAEQGAGRAHPLIRPPALLASLIGLALKRLRYRPGLSLLALLRVILAVGLVTSAAFFAQAVDQVILSRELAEYSRITKRLPFSTKVYTFSSRRVPLSLERAETLGRNVAETLSTEVGLPVKHLGLSVDSGTLTLQTRAGSERYEPQQSLGQVHLVYVEGVTEQMEVVEGAPLAEGEAGPALEGWMHAAQAEEMGVQVGDQFDLVVNSSLAPLPIRVQGFWQAADPKDPFWFSNPDQLLRQALLVSRQDYVSHVEAALPIKVRGADWHIILDESEVIPARARQYVAGFKRSQTIIDKYLPDARLTAPSLSLEKFVRRQSTLTILLLGFNVPAFGFLLYFLVLTSAVIAYWQRREVAILISRGMRVITILNLTLVEELLLFLVGCPLGLAFGLGLARLMGYTDSFLSFDSARPALPVSGRGLNLTLVVIALGMVLLARLLPAAQAARQTVVAQEREHTRPRRGPFWYRYYLDLLLIAPTAYAYDQLTQRGTLALLVRDRPEDLFRDPLLILVPALFILTLALLAMRLFPLLMRLLDVVANQVPWTIPHLTLRQLGRQHHNYINPLLLVIVSLALGVYTLSMAASLDRWLTDRIYYRVGADLTFEPFLESELVSQEVGASWVPPPAEFAGLPGVAAAARVGDYPAEIALASRSNRLKGRFLAVDRIDFPAVARFRSDFAAEPLGALMNRLALQPDGILVSQDFLEANLLRIGDQISLHVVTDVGAGVKSPFTVVGTYRYFPTVREDEVTIIGNLEYLFSFFGLTMPHRIWLRTQPGADGEAVLESIPTTGVKTTAAQDAQALITAQQAQMERVGVFGTLSISFLAAVVMAAMGLLIYSYASLQERFYYFAVLRALGLRRYQIIGQVIGEYVLLTAYGAAAGVLAGSIATELFVPLFRVTGGTGVASPPLLPVIAQDQIMPLAVTFAGIMIFLELIIIGGALFGRRFGVLRLGYQG